MMGGCGVARCLEGIWPTTVVPFEKTHAEQLGINREKTGERKKSTLHRTSCAAQ